MTRIILLFILSLSLFFQHVSGQMKIVDEVVAVVGDKRILYSDIEQNYQQIIAQGDKVDDNTRCFIMEQMLIQKLLLNQSEVDSLQITDSQVESSMDSRMKYFVNAIGSEEKLEAYFNKSILEIKMDLRDDIQEQLLTSKMRDKITEGLTVTPSEVRSFFKTIPPDSLPYINAEVEYNQILVHPKSNDQAVLDVREKLLGIRERILKGESFATQAVLYSEDQASAVKGGDIGWMAKSDLDPDYVKAAFALKKGAVSKIVESDFGYHLIQCLDRTDERIHSRHILLRPNVSTQEKQDAIARLDSIIRLVRLDSLKFEMAAMRFSEDVDTRVNGGQTVNPQVGGTLWGMDEFQPAEYNIISKMKVGEISNPYEAIDSKGKLTYKVIWLKNRTNPHVANLKDDYNLFKAKALQNKQNEVVNEWVEEKIKSTYIRIIDNYKSCPYSLKGWQKS
jgi:peptidyl-prolyl cis-trans isomerase SurA